MVFIIKQDALSGTLMKYIDLTKSVRVTLQRGHLLNEHYSVWKNANRTLSLGAHNPYYTLNMISITYPIVSRCLVWILLIKLGLKNVTIESRIWTLFSNRKMTVTPSIIAPIKNWNINICYIALQTNHKRCEYAYSVGYVHCGKFGIVHFSVYDTLFQAVFQLWLHIFSFSYFIM